jgi:DNA-binding response OmpR family regulator
MTDARTHARTHARTDSSVSPGSQRKCSPAAGHCESKEPCGPTGEGALAGLSILVVDDDDVLSRACRRALVRAGADAIVARSVAEARVALAARRFSAWVLDRRLPDGDAYLELALDRRSHGVEPIAVVCMSAYAHRAHTQLALDRVGAVVVSKPFDDRVLRAAVLRACEKVGISVQRRVRFGPFTFDSESRTIQRRGDSLLRIRGREAAVLHTLLLAEAHERLDGWEIARRAWGRSRASLGADNSVRQAITHLRRVLDDARHEVIRHERGSGYWVLR